MSNARNLARLTLSNTGTIGTANVADGAITYAKMAASGWTNTQATNGYSRLPNGMILQWGTTGRSSGNNGGNAYAATSFPIAFPTAVVQVMTQFAEPNELNLAQSIVVVAKTTTNFTWLLCRYGGSAPTGTVMWMALGY